MNDIEKIHNRLLSILEWFHSFCEKNSLRYYALGGTMLGAVRHKGFIPWDDDIDVGMPRKDYELFLKLTACKMFDNYVVESYHDKKYDYIYPFTKIYDVSTTLVESARNPVRRGIYIDVFPLDGLTSSKDTLKKDYKVISFKQNMVSTLVCAISPHRNWYKNLAIILCRFLPKSVLNPLSVISSFDNSCSMNSFDSCKYGGNLMGNWGIKEVMNRKIYGIPTKYRFEGLIINGVQDYDKYLTNLYGDYMKLPAKSKRYSHHNYLELDFNHGYLDY